MTGLEIIGQSFFIERLRLINALNEITCSDLNKLEFFIIKNYITCATIKLKLRYTFAKIKKFGVR